MLVVPASRTWAEETNETILKEGAMRTYQLALVFLAIVVAGCARQGSSITMPLDIDGAASRNQREATTFKTLYVFDGKHGAESTAGLTAFNGVLYGTTSSGGKRNSGTVFSLTATGKERVLHNFSRRGSLPDAPVLALGGVLYGTTTWTGDDPGGGAYAIEPNGKFLWSRNFKGRYNGYNPQGGLTSLNGVLYGTMSEGGALDDGGFYRVTTHGKERELYAFKGSPDGSDPRGNLLLLDGVFYGTTAAGGTSSRSVGTVFRVTSSGREEVLYSFEGYSPGAKPVAGLVEMRGMLYGTTEEGGANYDGVVFSITKSGKENVVYNFGGRSGDGQRPMAQLIACHGKLYGTTFAGGAYGLGTVFELTTAGTESVLHSFGGGTDGAYPLAGLVAFDGLLYGTTSGSYASGTDGTVFAISP
jgi:uncharacterized repeat protein (TIGR03803 family)